MTDARGLFRAAVGGPVEAGPDMSAIARRGRAIRRRKRALLGGTAAVVVLGIASAASAFIGPAEDIVQQPLATPSVVASSAATPATPAPAPSSPVPAGAMSLDVYLLSPDYSCRPGAPLEPVQRVVPKTLAVTQAALQQLFAGPSASERARGLGSTFGLNTAGLLKSVRVQGGIAYVDLRDLLFTALPNASTSCGNVGFTAQIEQTLRQFPTSPEVHFAVEGDPVAYYEWAQIGCPLERGLLGDRCDPSPFQTPGPGSGLEPADGYVPAAGICAEPSGNIVTLVVDEESPQPRCTIVRGDQRLRVSGESARPGGAREPFTVSFASLPDRLVQPGQSTLFDRPFSEFWAPGVHKVTISSIPTYRGGGFTLVLRPR